MSGHNKWSKVKRKKELQDTAKSKLFSVFARNITQAAQETKGDKDSPSLRAAIEKARAANMPSDNIKRAITKGAGAGDTQNRPVRYEVFGPGGTAMIINGATDNINRTSAELKHLLSKHGLELGAPGTTSWAFENSGMKWAPKTKISVSKDNAKKLSVIVEELENHMDINDVFTNIEK